MTTDEKRQAIFKYCNTKSFSINRLGKSLSFLRNNNKIDTKTYEKLNVLYKAINQNEGSWILLINLMYNIIKNDNTR